MKTWKPEEIALLGSNLSTRGIATKLNRPEASVRYKRNQYRIEHPVAAKKPTSFEQDLEENKQAYWKRQHDDLLSKYNKALVEQTAVNLLVAEAEVLAPKSYSSAPAITRVRKSSSKDLPQSAFLIFSDTHVGKHVPADQTLGFGSYGFDMFLARLKFLEESIISVAQNHTTTRLDELVVAMLGDMMDGALNHSAEAAQQSTLFQQFYGAGHAIAQFFRSLAQHFPQIRIFTTVGNHTRWGTQRKMPSDNRYSNLDMFLYAYVQALTHDIKNIQWNLDTQPFAIFEVQGFIFHGSHGDHLRGGDKALGIPNHAIGRNISVTTQLFAKYGKKAPNYYVTGHLHRGIKIPHALGSFIINGGFPGLDNYALGESFNPVDPTQTFFMVHPKYGKTASYEIELKWAEISKTRPYEIPPGISV